MAKILALESDAQEFRLLVGTPRGRDVVIEEALSIPTSEDSDANAAALAAVLESRKIDKADVFVAIGRSQVELRLLSLPFSPPEELPEMVRFQAMRQFANIGETWPLDFVTLSETSDHSQMNVLAAAISPEQVEQIRTGCSAAHLSPRRMVLRPFASASLLRHQGKASQGDCQLLVSMTSSEAELTVLSDGQAAFLRAVRLPLDDVGNLVPKALVGEVRRTIGAAQNQLNGRTVDKICLCQGASEASALVDSLASELSLEIDRFDPFDGMRLSKKLASEPPAYPGRFAGLLGVLADEAKETHTGIDFLHPRQKPPPPSKLRRNVWIGTGSGAIAAAVLLYVTATIWRKNTEIADLKATIAANQKNLEVAQQDIENEAAISVFLQGDITWLDELLWLSQTFPDAEDALIKTLSLNANSKQGGRIDLDAFARTGETIGRAEAVLRDERHEVQPDGSQEDASKKGYYHSFRERILVQKDQSLPSRLVQGEGTDQREDGTEDGTEGNAVDPSDESDPPQTDPAESAPNSEPSERGSATDATTRAVSAREDLEGGGELKMTQREKLLAGAVAVLVLLVLGTFAFNQFQDAVDAKDAEIRNLTSRVKTEKFTIDVKGIRARKKYNDYLDRSLPGISAVASSRYSDWLRQVVEDVGLDNSKVDYVAARNRGELYKQLQFDIVGKGSLGQVTEFLFAFYQQKHLHRIDRLILQPTGKTLELLNISMRIEAVAMSAQKDKVDLQPMKEAWRSASSDRLRLEKLADYDRFIAGRNLFAPGNQVPRFVTDEDAQEMTLGRRGSVRIRADAGDRGQDLTFRLISTNYPDADEIPKESESGRFSFTPEKTGDFNMVVEVQDSGPGPNNKATKEFAFTVKEPEPEPEREDPPPDFDVARSMYITAVIERNGEPQLWLHLRTTNETIQLRTGDEFSVADATGRVREISYETGRVEFELGGQIWQARRGGNLADVEAVGEVDEATN